MAVAKVIEITSGSSKGIEDAVRKGVKAASKSVKNIKGAWVNETSCVCDGGKIVEWRVNMRITFVVD